MDDLINRVNAHQNIYVYLNTEAINTVGTVGDFAIKLQTNGDDPKEIHVGTLTIATGFDNYEPMKGEFGFQGGVLKEVKSGYILAVFSGATGEQDVELANEGIDWLYKHY